MKDFSKHRMRIFVPLFVLLLLAVAVGAVQAAPAAPNACLPAGAIGWIKIDKYSAGGTATFDFNSNLWSAVPSGDVNLPHRHTLTTVAPSNYATTGATNIWGAGGCATATTSWVELPEPGFILYDIQCTSNAGNPTIVTNVATGRVDVTFDGNDPAPTVTCTYYNAVPAKVTISKFVDNAPDAGVPFTFNLSGPKSWNVQVKQSDGVVTSPDLGPGTYALAEDLSAMPQWRLDKMLCKTNPGGVSVDPAAIVLAAGDRVDCVVQDKRLGEIKVQKRPKPDNDGTHFEIKVTGPDTLPPGGPLPKTFDMVGNQDGSVWVLVGSGYGVAETPVPDWDLDPANSYCVDINGTKIADWTNFAVVPSGPAGNPAATCFFFNVKRGKITIEKNTIGGDGAFGFTTTSGPDTPLPAAFSLTTAGGTVSQTWNSLKPGTYTVTEDDPIALAWPYDLTDLTCVDGANNVVVSTWDKPTRKATINLDPGEDVKCTFTDTKRGKVVIDKVTTPGANAVDQFTFTPSWTAAFQLTDVSAPWEWFLPPGTQSVVETVPSNFVLNSVNCVDPSNDSPGDVATAKATINVGAGELITCTFGNWQKGQIITEKKSIGGTDKFKFQSTSGLIGGFDIDTAANNPEVSNSALLPPGQYVIAELAKTDWDLTSLTCDDANSTGVIDPTGANGTGAGTGGTATINVEPGEIVKCTFENTKRGIIRAWKKTVGSRGTFDYTLTGLPPFQVGTTVNNPNVSGYPNVIPGTYTLAELAQQPGWDLASLTCAEAGGDSIANTTTAINANNAGGSAVVILEPGEVVDCTFVNHAWGKIIIDKQVQSENPADNDVKFQLHGVPPANRTDPAWGDFQMAGSTPNFEQAVPPDVVYSITEDMLPGWMADSYNTYCEPYTGVPGNQPTTAVKVPPGENVKCYFTNRKLAWISLEKRVTPAAETKSFNFTTTYAGDINLTGQDAPVGQWVTPGVDLSITENLTDPEWYLDAFDCVPTFGSAVVKVLTTATVTPKNGDTIACFYSNIKKAHILVDKIAVSGDPADQDVDFTFTKHLPAPGAFDWSANDGVWDSGPIMPFNADNTVDVWETGIPTGWDLTDAVCTRGDGSTLNPQVSWINNIKPAEIIKCVFTNTKRAEITVKKVVLPATDQTPFVFTTTGAGYTGFTLGTTTVLEDKQLVVPGAYSVEETDPGAPWVTDVDCKVVQAGAGVDSVVKTGRKVDITASAGAKIECTYTNTHLGQIQVAKTVVPNNLTNNATLFDMTIAGPTPDALQVSQNNSWQISKWLALGTYSLTEAAKAGWTLKSIECFDPAGNPEAANAIVIKPGEVHKCVVTNHAWGKIIVDKQVQSSNPADNDVLFQLHASPNWGDFQMAGSTALVEKDVPPDVVYSITEDMLPGWMADSYNTYCEPYDSVAGNQLTTAVKVAPGQTVKCYFTNRKLGKIIVDKVTNPAKDPQSFSFKTDGAGYNDFALTDQSAPNEQWVTPGFAGTTYTYKVKEAAEDWWDILSVTCVKAAWMASLPATTSANSATIKPGAGDVVTCTFNNVKKGWITIEKKAVSVVAADHSQKFGFSTRLPDPIAGGFNWAETDGVWNSGPLSAYPIFNGAGNGYAVWETTVPSGWDLTGAVCTRGDGSTVDPQVFWLALNPAEHIHCVFTNTKRGTIIIKKTTVPTWGPISTLKFKFSHDIDPADPNFKKANGEQKKFKDVLPNATYHVTEASQAPIGVLTNILCTENGTANSGGAWDLFNWTGGTATIKLEPGETVTCTFINTNAKPLKIVASNLQSQNTLVVRGGLPVGTFVGGLHTEDPYPDTFVYKLVPNVPAPASWADNWRFMITPDGRVMTRYVFTAPATYQIWVRSTDSNGWWIEQGFTVNVVP